MTETPRLTEIADTIAVLLQATPDADNFPRLYVPSDRRITRLGFALEPNFDVAEWIESRNLDAVFLHRPWRLDKNVLPESVGIVAFHQPLDATLAVGYNPRLADALGIQHATPLGEKDGLPLGMIGDIQAASWETFTRDLRREFGGLERIVPPLNTTIERVAIMGAMNDDLVRAAHEAGADAYLTGQLRMPARAAVQETSIGVVAIGHARGERWGLRTLARLLRHSYPGLQTLLR